MADNLAVTPGTGATVAADDVSGVLFQKIKRNFGANGVDADGLSFDRRSALSNTAVAVKASAGLVHGYHFYNPNATVAFVQFYDVAQASVTVGTTTPSLTLAVVPLGGVDMVFSSPLNFATAITIAATTTITGGTAPTTGLLTDVFYA